MNFLRHLALQGKKNLMTAHVSILLKSCASLTCFRPCLIPARAKDLSAPKYRTPGQVWEGENNKFRFVTLRKNFSTYMVHCTVSSDAVSEFTSVYASFILAGCVLKLFIYLSRGSGIAQSVQGLGCCTDN